VTRRFLAGQVETTITLRDDTWQALVRIGKALPHGGVEPEVLVSSIVKEFVRRQPEHEATAAGPDPVVAPPVKRIRPELRKVDRDGVTRLHALGLSDPKIAEALGVSSPAVWAVRKELGLPTNNPKNKRRSA
jgi:hypothetical protein